MDTYKEPVTSETLHLYTQRTSYVGLYTDSCTYHLQM